MTGLRRRGWLAAGVGVAAAAAGAGWALRRATTTLPDVPADLWAQRFARPEGGELQMAALRGRPLLLNFWATWCPPCVRELPAIDRFARAHAAAGWQVIGLAVDGPTPVREFLRKQPLSFAIGLAGFEGTELSRTLGNTAGALPFTVVIDRHGRIAGRKLGETTAADLDAWALAA